ncbi:MAG: class I SAM-dependent methyltransferase, partial [Bacteroidia bacterium]|nr:class I SAM-dependent methyltransferase [Bacteroidia bacterium]
LSLELGTNLGFSTLYWLFGNSSGSLITIEGSESLARFAGSLFQKLSLKPVQIVGSFEEQLPRILQQNHRFDLIFLDGNHRSEACIRYVEQLLPYCNPGALIVMDDIYWSPDMLDGWNTIIQKPEISVSVDTFELGFLVVNRPQAKQHFQLRW